MADSPGTKDLGDRVRSLRLGDRDSAGPPLPRSRHLPWLVSLVLLLVSVAFGYRAYRVGALTGGAEPARDERKAEQQQSGSSASASAGGVAAAAGEVVLPAKGYVTPISLVQVSPKVGGQLEYINPSFEEGKRFKEGDLLARIEQRDYKADRDQALATWQSAQARYKELEATLPEEIKQAEADLEEARNTATQLRLDMDRNRRLMAGNAIAQREMEQAKYGYEATAAKVKRLQSTLRMIRDGRWQLRLAQARADAEQAKAAYERAQTRFEWTEIRAPISGTVLSKKAEKGNIVNPSAFSSGISASLCEMANLREVEIDLSIQERDIAVVHPGQPCRAMPEAYQADKEFLARYPQGYPGYVSRLMPQADRAKGAIPVRVRIKDIPEDEAGKYLRPDMGVLVHFLRAPEKTASPGGK